MKISSKNISHFTYFVLSLIIISSATVYTLTAYLKDINIDLPWYISLPSVPAIYLILFRLFDQYLWKYRAFRFAMGVTSPNISGVWTGYVKSSFDNFKKKYPVTMNISQTATSTKVRATYSQSKSVSLNAGFEPSEIDGCDALFYFYRNEPNPDAHIDMAIHEGSTKLVYDPKKDVLTGSYYSGRDRNNFGEIHLKRRKDGIK